MSVALLLPSGAAGDGGTSPANRTDGYGDQFVVPVSGKDVGGALEGSYYVAISPTAGTGIAGHAAPTTFDETKPYLLVYNGSAQRLYPQFLRLHDTAASTGGARVQFTITRDVGNLYTSGGTAAVIANTNSEAQGNASGVIITQGAVIAPAATSNRALLGNYCLRGTIDIIEDTYTLVFGGTDGFVAGSRVATVEDLAQALPPMCIGPGKCLKVHQWAASQSAGPTFEMVFGFVLR